MHTKRNLFEKIKNRRFVRRFMIIVTLNVSLRDILEVFVHPVLYLDFNRSAETRTVVVVGCRRRRRDFGIRWVRDVHFSFSSVAHHPPPRTRMTRRIVLFERENTTTRKLLLTRSRATIRVFAGSSISFYLVTLSLRRRVEVRVTGKDEVEEVWEEAKDSGEARRKMLRKSFPEESCSPLTISKGEHPS